MQEPRLIYKHPRHRAKNDACRKVQSPRVHVGNFSRLGSESVMLSSLNCNLPDDDSASCKDALLGSFFPRRTYGDGCMRSADNASLEVCARDGQTGHVVGSGTHAKPDLPRANKMPSSECAL